MPLLTVEQLEEIKRVNEERTPGRWSYHLNGEEYVLTVGNDVVCIANAQANAYFIAHATEYIPLVMETLDKLDVAAMQKELIYLRTRVEDLSQAVSNGKLALEQARVETEEKVNAAYAEGHTHGYSDGYTAGEETTLKKQQEEVEQSEIEQGEEEINK